MLTADPTSSQIVDYVLDDTGSTVNLAGPLTFISVLLFINNNDEWSGFTSNSSKMLQFSNGFFLLIQHSKIK